eukprot:CAMPEP_0182440280 /NCGR_PEP_ID=MMETSP1167-20130531/86962_1 /TAXON_ID=2988 /ORGANISM="Mallomonas Sp, Strain CCMP3275" /LENGTH=256 /DNA_ID=CAMNT_0024634189 /DNA_START=692 /DNA_END=1462 /DNA_ORIENTATION=-
MLEVEFSDLVRMILSIRKGLERETEREVAGLLRDLVIDDDKQDGKEERKCEKESGITETERERERETNGGIETEKETEVERERERKRGKETVDRVINQTWDLVESPIFTAALTEALDCCFERVFLEIRRAVYGSSTHPHSNTGAAPGGGGGGGEGGTDTGTAGWTSQRRPPLATLLPQLKSLSSRLLEDTGRPVAPSPSSPSPSSAGGTNGMGTVSVSASGQGTSRPVWKDICDGPLLEEMCVGVFDSLCMQHIKE